MPEGPGDGAAQLALKAQELWVARRFDACAQALEELRVAKPDNPKVLHNIAIAKHRKDGAQDPEGLLEALSKVQEAIRTGVGLGLACGDLGSAGQISAAASGTPTISEIYVLTAEESVVTLNMAIVKYQQKQLHEVVSLLEPLFNQIGPLDDGVALRVCILLLRVYIQLQETTKAHNVLGLLEKMYGNLFKLDDRDSNSDMMGDGAIGINGDSTSSNTDESDVLVPDTCSLFLPTLSRSGTSLLPAQPAVSLKNGDTREKNQNIEVKISVHLYRAKLLFDLQNFKGVNRELKCILGNSPSNVAALFLKAQLHYSKGSFRKAGRILARCVAGDQEPSGIRVLALCDMGVIYHRLGKHNLACLCFSNSLKKLSDLSCSRLSNFETPVPDEGAIQEQHLRLLYNLGLQHLMLRHHGTALQCFKDSAILFFDEPVLWLRMGECCLGKYQQERNKGLKSLASGGNGHIQGPVVVHVIGGESSSSRQLLVLPPGSDRGQHEGVGRETTASSGEQNSTIGDPLLTEGAIYFQNALCLLDRLERQLENEEVDGFLGQPVPDTMLDLNSGVAGMGGSGESVRANSVGSTVQQQEELSLVRQSVLVNLAYLHLIEDKPELALVTVESLMLIPNLMRHVSLLAHCYAAEALCILDRASEAADRLGMYMAQLADDSTTTVEMDSWCATSGMPPGVTSSACHTQQCRTAQDVAALTGPSARATLYVNLASVYATQGELLQAQQCARRAIAYDPSSTQALLILVYVELAQGNNETALALMKREKL